MREARQLFGDERFERYMRAFEEEPPVSIRLNPRKLKQGEWSVTDGEPVPWCPDGYYLSRRPQFTMDPLLHAGCYYVQEAASMFLWWALTHAQHSPFCTQPSAALDLCAAPGGKSTLLRSVLPEEWLLTSNEPNGKRCKVLAENVSKWGYENHRVTNLYPRDFVKSGMRFPLILCDVPCSGEGMFRKDAATISEWSPQNVEKCWRLQREIVCDAWQCLEEGGLIIYSTCTFNTKENEENIRYFMEELGAEVLPVEGVKPEWNITGSLLEGFHEPVYRFIPGTSRGEGLFMAVMRKKPHKPYKPHEPHKPHKPHEPHEPHEPHAPLTYQQAISYLRREAIVLPEGTPRGLVSVTFMGQPLGLVKNIGTRANNLYPKEWRIKTTYIPQEYEAILRHSEPHPDGGHREG